MDRIEKMKVYLTPYLIERTRIKIEELRQNKNDNLMLISLLRYALDKQKKQPDWKPSNMGMFHLMTGLMTESHEYELLIADHQMYLDEMQVVDFWKLDRFFNDQQEEEYIKEWLQRKFVRINQFEILALKQWVFYEFRHLLEVYWKTEVSRIVVLKEFRELQISTPFLFLFGDYMGEVHTILKYDREETQDGK